MSATLIVHDRTQTTSRQVVSTRRNNTGGLQTAASAWNHQTERVARGTFVMAGGHRITAYASHLDSVLSFEGRVSGRERCQSLELTGYLQNNQGKRWRLGAIAENVGGPSRVFESRHWKVSPLKCGWEVYRVDAVCIGK